MFSLVGLIAIFQIVAADYSVPLNFFFAFKIPAVQFIVDGSDKINFEFLNVPFLGERPTVILNKNKKFTFMKDFFSVDPEPIDILSLKKYSTFSKVLQLNENVCEHLDLLGGLQKNSYLLLSVPRKSSIKYLPDCICTHVYEKDIATEIYHGLLGEELLRPKSDCSLIDQDHVIFITLNDELKDHMELLKNNMIGLPNNNFFVKYNNNWIFSWKNDQITKTYTRAFSNDINFSDCQNILYFLQDGGDLIEFGSYIGDHYIYFHPNFHPNTRIHAFEPSHYYDVLTLLKFMYRLENVIPSKQALHRASNQTLEFLNVLSQSSTLFSPKTGFSNSHVSQVNTITIDEYWEKANIDNRINIIRVDIEGGEWGSLLSASKYFSTAKLPIMYVEFHFHNFEFFENDYYDFLKYARHNLEIYYTENCSKKFNIQALGASRNYIPDPQYYETIVVAKYFAAEFENEICPKLKKFQLSVERKPLDSFRGFYKLSNGFYSIGNRLNNQNLLDSIPTNKKILIFINVDDHFIITQSVNTKRCHKAIIYFSDNELLDYTRYTLAINGLNKKVSLSYFTELEDILAGTSKIARNEGIVLVGKANSKECNIISQLERNIEIIPAFACENEYQDL